MNANNIKTKRFFAEVFFLSKSGNPCTCHRYMNAKDEEEVYEKMTGKVKKLKYFDRIDRVDIVKMQVFDK